MTRGQRVAGPRGQRAMAERRELELRAVRAVADAARTRPLGRWRTPLVLASTVDVLRAVESGVTVDELELPDVDDAMDALERSGASLPHDMDVDQLRGWVAAVRGASGELRTSAGIASGAIPTPGGTRVVELLPFTEPGADLRIEGTFGTVLANVKMTSDADAIVRHLGLHPDVPVVYASREAAADAARRGLTVVADEIDFSGGHPVVVDTGISVRELDGDLARAFEHPVSADDVQGIEHLVERLDGHPADWLPAATIAVVTLRTVSRLRAGQSIRSALDGFASDAARAGASAGAGKVMTVLSGEPILGLTGAIVVGAVVSGAREPWTTAAASERELRARAKHALKAPTSPTRRTSKWRA